MYVLFNILNKVHKIFLRLMKNALIKNRIDELFLINFILVKCFQLYLS